MTASSAGVGDTAPPALSLDEIKRRLRLFAGNESQGSSPLYRHLAEHAANDDDVAALLLVAPPRQAQATLLLAAAHRLLQAEPLHPLSRYYPSLGGFDGVDSETWPLFRTFLLERAEKAKRLIEVRRTQTNEVRRAAPLMPAVAIAAREAGSPVALVEVGTSAGLLLGMDTFGYRYQLPDGEIVSVGPSKTALVLHCAVELAPGATLPKLPKRVPIATKIGLDESPIDAQDEEELAWLEACVWADQPDRIRMLRAAAQAQEKQPPTLVAGDAIRDLPRVVNGIPSELPVVIMTSRVGPYLNKTERTDLVRTLRGLAVERPLWWVSGEQYEFGVRTLAPDVEGLDQHWTYRPGYSSLVSLVRWPDGKPELRILAETAPHGQRMYWR